MGREAFVLGRWQGLEGSVSGFVSALSADSLLSAASVH